MRSTREVFGEFNDEMRKKAAANNSDFMVKMREKIGRPMNAEEIEEVRQEVRDRTKKLEELRAKIQELESSGISKTPELSQLKDQVIINEARLDIATRLLENIESGK